MTSLRVKLPVDQVRDRRLSRPGKACEPHNARTLSLCRSARFLVELERLPMEVLRAAKREAEKTSPDRVVAQAVDENKSAGMAILYVGIERNRCSQLDRTDSNFVEFEFCGSDV